MDLWEEIKRQLAGEITAEGYQNWVSKTKLSHVDGETVWVSVPNDVTREWMETEYAPQVQRVIRTLGLPIRAIRYQNGSVVTSNGQYQAIADPLNFNNLHLNPKLTFDSFVVGSCNQFAHAAAVAVSKNPANGYNPLFIYGGTGMGKTHLMHAIGRGLAERYSGLRVVYTTSERFVNQMVQSLKADRMAMFQQHYRSADVLLVDDVQHFAGKERTQLMVDVQPPDLETKMAILDKKAEAEGIALPDEVRIFLATKTKSNVRELEGALIKLTAFSSVTGERISLPMAQQVLKHLSQGTDKRISIESIIRLVAEKHSMQPAQLKQKSNERKIAYPRQIAMYLAKELTNSSLPEIGRAFGGKHHTTVLHSVQKIETLRLKDPELNKFIHSLSDTLTVG
ncbi:MAG: chromosomal replication initiator protein DnaA [Acidobacteria bacterium]|nr:chromosomal replication initiator protein DnaA [Acidobacteriota bacterium]